MKDQKLQQGELLLLKWNAARVVLCNQRRWSSTFCRLFGWEPEANRQTFALVERQQQNLFSSGRLGIQS